MASQGAENGLGATINRSTGFDELDGLFELLARHLRKSNWYGRVLEWQIVNLFAGQALPASNPQLAKIAVTIKNHERFGRRGGNLNCEFHKPVIAPPQAMRQPAETD